MEGPIHGIQGSSPGGTTNAIYQRLPRRTHRDRFHRHRHQPAAKFRPLSLQQSRLRLPERKRQGKIPTVYRVAM